MESPDQLIGHRIKAIAEDFRVVEVTDLRPARRGEYRLYRLTKSGWNTVDLLLHLSRRLRIPLAELSYGGRKDRHALTTQFVTLRDRRDLSTRGEGFTFEAVGFVAERMRPARVRANEFAVVLRGLDPRDLTRIGENVKAVRKQGLPDYFDDQRFGPFDRERGFVAEALLRGRWREALELHVTMLRPEERDADRQRRRFFADHWGNWKGCLTRARTVTERRIFEHLLQRKEDARGALELIPREEMSMALSSFQSFLWNEMAAAAVRETAQEVVGVPGAVRPYLFYTTIDPGALAILAKLVIPMPGPAPRFRDPPAASLYDRILAREGLADCPFRFAGLSTAYLKSFPRAVHLRPRDLVAGQAEPDDLTPGRSKLALRFVLPRGAYGTMVVKRLMLAG